MSVALPVPQGELDGEVEGVRVPQAVLLCDTVTEGESDCVMLLVAQAEAEGEGVPTSEAEGDSEPPPPLPPALTLGEAELVTHAERVGG